MRHTAFRRPLAQGTADVHLIGEITGAVGFTGGEALYCTWQIVHDQSQWTIRQGASKVRNSICTAAAAAAAAARAADTGIA